MKNIAESVNNDCLDHENDITELINEDELITNDEKNVEDDENENLESVRNIMSKCRLDEAATEDRKVRITLMNLIRNDTELIAFTGVSFQLLNSLVEAIGICENKGYSKRFVLPLRERIVLCLCKLKLNLSYICIAALFGITRQSAARNFIYMVDLMSKVLKSIIYWPTYEEIKNSIPKCFLQFKNTFLVLDCTEIFIEKL